MKILLTVSYDGTGYSGWQRQENGVTIQEKLEYALYLLYKKEITVAGAGRTDAGVHALGQKACFEIDEALNVIPLEKLPQVINTKLPDEIAIIDAKEVDINFDPRYGAEEKTYTYKIYSAKTRNPMLRNYAWNVREPLDLEAMVTASKAFIGTHDFAGFQATGSTPRLTVRTINSLSITQQNGIITLEVVGKSFLYNMVRIIAGTLVFVGMGKIPQEKMGEIIKTRDRKQAGKTAPPQGLTLVDIKY